MNSTDTTHRNGTAPQVSIQDCFWNMRHALEKGLVCFTCKLRLDRDNSIRDRWLMWQSTSLHRIWWVTNVDVMPSRRMFTLSIHVYSKLHSKSVILQWKYINMEVVTINCVYVQQTSA